MDRHPAVYILANAPRGTLYIGVTSNLSKRIWIHKNHMVRGFTQRYDLNKLVWYEAHESMETAICREKSLKYWKRIWKIQLIEETNPAWRDLYSDLMDNNLTA